MTSVKTLHQDLLVPFTDSGRNHKLVVLPNGILTLLVSDPTEDLASAALCVSAGAHNDPDEIPGLAHFCEHLILLGSKDFPNPNEFHGALSKSGGRRNAFTTGEQTCYFFETPSDFTWKGKDGLEEPVFNHLLKVFSSALKAPSFSEKSFEKEIYAVDNEHNANKNSAGRLMYHGLRLLSNKEHPFHRFATGNYFSLNDLPKIGKVKVKDYLVKYYQENYVADKMTLVVRGSQSINILQKLALSNFGDIATSSDRESGKKSKLRILSSKNKDSSNTKSISNDISSFKVESHWNYNSPVFANSADGNCIFIKKDQSPTLRLAFPVHFDSCDPITSREVAIFENAWSNIVGDEGKGSLDSYLKQTDLITSLGAFTQHIAKDDDVLIIEIKLTNNGAKNLGVILSCIFNNYIQNAFVDKEALGRYLSEMESIDLLNYLHRNSSKSPMEQSSTYSQTLQKNLKSLGPENILKGLPNFSNVAEGFFESPNGKIEWTQKGSLFQKFVKNYFNNSDMKLILIAGQQNIEKASSLLVNPSSSTDTYFAYEYTSGVLDINKLPKDTGEADFHVVDKNIFIPNSALRYSKLKEKLRDASLKSSQSSLGYNTKNAWSSSEAQLVSKSEDLEIWTKHETSLSYRSRLALSFDIVCTSMESTPENTMNVEILSEILNIKLAEKLYGAELLNYTWEIFAASKGDTRIGFIISGFKDGVDTILKSFLDQLTVLFTEPVITNDEFRKSRVSVRSRYRELTEASSFILASTGLLVVMEEKMWSLEDRLEALDDIDIQSFKSFIKHFGDGSKYLKLFAQGELDSTDRLVESLNSTLINRKNTVKLVEPSTVLLAPGTSYHIERSSAVDDPMNSIAYFLQTGARGDAFTEKLTKIFAYLMAFNLVPDLRNKRQLGYVVLGGQRILRTTLGLHVTIMSAGFSPEYLEQKINEYLLSWEKSLEQLTEQEFKDQIIKPYLKNYKQTMESSADPESLTAELQASVGSSNVSSAGDLLKVHKRLRDLILMDAYTSKNEAEDVEFCNGLSKAVFLKFFKQRISPVSKTRAQVSVMLKSQMSSGEIQQQMMRLQLEAFLKIHGLRISSEKLEEIVGETKGSSVGLLKELFKYFMSQGESFKLCTIVLKEVVKQTVEGVKAYKNSPTATTESSSDIISSQKINSIDGFQSKNKILYRP